TVWSGDSTLNAASVGFENVTLIPARESDHSAWIWIGMGLGVIAGVTGIAVALRRHPARKAAHLKRPRSGKRGSAGIFTVTSSLFTVLVVSALAGMPVMTGSVPGQDVATILFSLVAGGIAMAASMGGSGRHSQSELPDPWKLERVAAIV